MTVAPSRETALPSCSISCLWSSTLRGRRASWGNAFACVHGAMLSCFSHTCPLSTLANASTITAADVERLVGRRSAEPAGLGNLVDCATFEEFKQAAERAFLQAKLRAFDWNVSETARALDMPRSNLYKKIERYGLTRESAPETTATVR